MRLILKTLMVFGLTVAILVPLMMIRGTIQERQMYRNQAVQEVARTSAGAQAIAAPILIVTYTDLVDVDEKNDRGETIRTVKQEVAGRWVFFPQTLDTRGTIAPQSRFRGIHEVRSYELESKISAQFQVEIPTDETPASPRTIVGAYLNYAIADVKGLRGVPKLALDGRELKLDRGLGGGDGTGLHATLATPAPGASMNFRATLDFTLEGTETLSIMPLAQRNTIELTSTWKHPQFSGSFTTREKKIDEKGFRALWEVSSLASNAQAQYLAGKMPSGFAIGGGVEQVGEADVVSVSLVDPVNIYSQADRASKYGILFVVLTFVGFFMFELIKQLRIHPIQYGLVGLALAIFFLLLIALSEHIDFGLAYSIASGACIGLLGFYVSHVLGSYLRGLGFATMIATLYAALYGLLISEDNAMVMGAGLLFAILAAIMVLTRKVDWYAVGASVSPAPRAPAQHAANPSQAPTPPPVPAGTQPG
jgi:inner membrane protein